MIALRIPDLKAFTSRLFVQETFDPFQTVEATIITYTAVHIDGRMQPDFYSSEELEQMGNPEFSYWKQLRPFCFTVIKGSRLPKSFRIVLKLPGEKVSGFLQETGVRITPEEIQGLFLNIRYESGSLSCVTGTSLKGFTMDKSTERAWDQYVKNWLKQQEILFEEE